MSTDIDQPDIDKAGLAQPTTHTEDMAGGETVDYLDMLSTDYALYSHSTIMGRALPSAADGLKPVQRRILFQMYRDKLFPGRSPMKSQTISSAVMGHLHPHGDCYESMVNMANVSIRLPLVDGRGSFGVRYGVPAANQRYTEALLSGYGHMMVSELDRDCVPMRPNFNGQFQEPVTLPCKFPNLVINGADGVAVGFSTKIPRHNPSEVFEAVLLRARKPKCSVEDVLKVMPGPDYPTGGRVAATDPGIAEYYSTGDGTFTLRGSYEISGNTVTITELPYGISAETFRKNVTEGIDKGKITGVADLADLSDRTNGLRIEITVRRGVPARTVADQLLVHTRLTTTVAAHMVALDDEYVPRTMTMLQLLDAFLDHRRAVVKARCTDELAECQTRLTRLTGLITVMADLDTALDIIRKATTHAKASAGLVKAFSITEEQASAVLSLTLRSLTGQDVLELKAKADKAEAEAKRLAAIIDSPEELNKTVVAELKALKKDFSDPRRTLLVDSLEEVSATPVAAATSDTGWFLDADGMFDGSGGTPMSTGAVACLLFDDGRIKLTDGKGLPKSPQLTPAAPDLGGLVTATVLGPDQDMLIVTASGKMLRLAAAKIRPQGLAGNGVAGIALADGDRVIGAAPLGADQVVLTCSGLAHKVTAASEIPVKGRGAGGVMVHKLTKGDEAVDHFYVGRGFSVNGATAEPTPRSKATVKIPVEDFHEE